MSQHINSGARGNRVNILTESAGPAVTEKAARALKQAYNQTQISRTASNTFQSCGSYK